MKIVKYLLFVLVFVALLACGGGGSGVTVAKNGKISISITWPSPSRVIPVAATSIGISIKNSKGITVVSTLIAKPTTTWVSSDLPIDSYTLTATAYPNANATGTAQATGVTNFAPLDGQTSPVSISMGSTVSTVTLSSSTQLLKVGEAVQVSATCKDAQGNLVLVHPSTLNWSSSQSSIASTNLDGLVTGINAGTSNITATFTEVDSTLGQSPVTSAAFPISVASSTRIYFSTQGDSPLGGGIFSINPDGTGQKKHVTLSQTKWTGYTVSKDGSKIYSQPDGINPHDIHDLNGVLLGTFTIPGSAAIRSQSPWLDNDRMMTVQNDGSLPVGNGNGITIYNVATNTSFTFPGGPWHEYGGTAISSTKIASAARSSDGGIVDLYIHDLANNSSIKIETGGTSIWPLSYDLNSNFLFCQKDSGQFTDDWDVYKVKPDGTGLVNLTSDMPGISFAPVVSPNGTKVAFINSNSWWGQGTYSLWTMNLDGTSKTKLLEGSNLFGTQFTQLSPLTWR